MRKSLSCGGHRNWSRPYWRPLNKSGRTRGGSRVVGDVRTGPGLTGSCQTSQVGLEEVVELLGDVRTGPGLTGSCQTSQVGLEEVVELWGMSELVQALLEAVKQVR